MGTPTRIKLKDEFWKILKKNCDKYGYSYRDLSLDIKRNEKYISDCFGSKPKSIPLHRFNKLIDSLMEYISFKNQELEDDEELRDIFEELVSNSNSTRAYGWGHGYKSSCYKEDIEDIANLLSRLIDDIDDGDKKIEFLETISENLSYPVAEFVIEFFSIDFTKFRTNKQRDTFIKTIKEQLAELTR